jgi:hypothetical protein
VFIPSGRKPYRDQSEKIYSLYYLMASEWVARLRLIMNFYRDNIEHLIITGCKFPRKNMVLPSVESLIIPLGLNTCKNMEFIDFFSKTQQNIVYPQSTTFP